jgi:hypothetical protein
MLKYQTLSVPSFVDYLKEGWTISTVVGIDFTASNGNPASKTSLHSFGPNNQYIKTLEQLLHVLERFERNITVFGFGA